MAAYKLSGKSPTAIDLHKELNPLKKTEFGWMYAVSKCAMQEALRDLDKAFAHFFRRVKLKKAGKLPKGEKVGYPRFKSKKKGLGSFRLTGAIRVMGKHVQLPRLGVLRLKESGYIPTSGVKILGATVSERAGHWFVSIQVEEEVPEPTPATGEPSGVDLGITSMAITSDGRKFVNPKALKSNTKRLIRLQRQLSRRKSGSKNREKARKLLARQHYRIANIRLDALHKATTAICAITKPDSERPSVVVLESLNVAGMMKNHKLALACADVGFYEFKRQVIYKAEFGGTQVLEADRFYPSSKKCCNCGNVKAELSLKERVYHCHECGYVIDRDLNAAINLQSLAYNWLAALEG
jgi:putative transposase